MPRFYQNIADRQYRNFTNLSVVDLLVLRGRDCTSRSGVAGGAGVRTSLTVLAGPDSDPRGGHGLCQGIVGRGMTPIRVLVTVLSIFLGVFPARRFVQWDNG